jgi:hypothetical protein
MRHGLTRLWQFFIHRRTRYVLAWLGCLILAGYSQHKALHIFDSRETEPERRRRDGNDGHVSIDFGGQWLLGRMVVLGHGRELYNRHRQYEVAQRAFAREAEAPAAKHHDADVLLDAFVDTEVQDREWSERETRERLVRATFAVPLGSTVPWSVFTATIVAHRTAWTAEQLDLLRSKHVGGPLYPPVHAMLMAPLAWDDEPQCAYFMMTWLMLVAAFVAGAGVSYLTECRIWWPVATAMMLGYPGFAGGHQLGQNAPLSAAIAVWGWALLARGREILGGGVLSLLAFKPTWAAAFLLLPLFTRRWRALGMMLVGGATWAALTLPLVGWESWRDWLTVGSVANRTYNVDGNWIFLSRDLLGIPRRWMINADPAVPYYLRDRWEAHVAGWAIWLVVFETTLRLSQQLPSLRQARTGHGASFLLLGAWFSCLHFMYYDVLLSFVAYMAVLDPPSRFLRPRLLILRPSNEASDVDPDFFAAKLMKKHPGNGAARILVVNSFVLYIGLTLLAIQWTLPWLDLTISIRGRHIRPMPESVTMTEKSDPAESFPPPVEITTDTKGPPWDTWCLLVLWVYCGVVAVIRSLRDATLDPERTFDLQPSAGIEARSG